MSAFVRIFLFLAAAIAAIVVAALIVKLVIALAVLAAIVLVAVYLYHFVAALYRRMCAPREKVMLGR
jgi:hypothetical protein